jgi:flagellar biogenesis protein FliO
MAASEQTTVSVSVAPRARLLVIDVGDRQPAVALTAEDAQNLIETLQLGLATLSRIAPEGTA